MRRSARRPVPAPRATPPERSDSPSNSEGAATLATPSVSPTPDVAVRQYPTPGHREDGTPKRPMNAFILFSNEMRGQLAELNPHLSNAAVSVLLGQRWRDMHANEKSSYVTAARRIKEDFHAAHPDAKVRSVSRKGKRKHADGGGGGRRVARQSVAPPSLHALALVGSRLNQSPFEAPPPPPPFRHGAASTNYAEYEDDEYGEEAECGAYDAYDDDQATTSSLGGDTSRASGLSLLEQLCTVAENEHTAAAHMLSAFAAC